MEIDELMKQRANVKFPMKRGKNSSKYIEMLNTVNEDNVLKKTTMFKWTKRFNEGCEGCKDTV